MLKNKIIISYGTDDQIVEPILEKLLQYIETPSVDVYRIHQFYKIHCIYVNEEEIALLLLTGFLKKIRKSDKHDVTDTIYGVYKFIQEEQIEYYIHRNILGDSDEYY